MGAEPIIVVNFSQACQGSKPLGEAALEVSGLVAYCNAKQGAKLPSGMPDWPAVRAKNGHPEPYGVKYWQIGNETRPPYYTPTGLATTSYALHHGPRLLARGSGAGGWAGLLVREA